MEDAFLRLLIAGARWPTGWLLPSAVHRPNVSGSGSMSELEAELTKLREELAEARMARCSKKGGSVLCARVAAK